MVDREGFVIEIRRGEGNPRFMALSPGKEVPPTSVGMLGQWRVEADGMLDVHGYLYFDGSALFVQSTDGHNAIRVNGKPIGASWTQVQPPCTLAIGDARLVYCPANQASAVSAPVPVRPAAGRGAMPFDDSAPTVADVRAEELSSPLYDESTRSIPLPGGKPIPPAPAEYDDQVPTAVSGPPSMGAHDEDNETTRALPLPQVPMPAPFGAPPPPPFPGAAPPLPPGYAGPHEPTGPIAAPPPAAPDAPKKGAKEQLEQLKQQFKEASLPKKAIVLLLPLAFVMVIFGLDDDAPAPTKKPKAAPSATAVAVKASSSVEELEDETPPKPTSEPTAPSTTAPTPAPPPAKTVAKASPPSPAASVKTAERMAVDAVVAGAWEPAAKMYEELAKAHPDNPAYAEAARILRLKAANKK